MPLVIGEGQAAISDYRGKVLLVNFFGGSSEECREEIAPLNALLAELNGKPLDRAWLRHGEIAGGGRLVLTMAGAPTKWPQGPPPPSASAEGTAPGAH